MCTQGEARVGGPVVHFWPSASDIHRPGAWAPCGAGESPLLGTNIPRSVTCGGCLRSVVYRRAATVTVTHSGACSIAYNAAACDCGAVEAARSVPVTWTEARLRRARLLRRPKWKGEPAPTGYVNPNRETRGTVDGLPAELRRLADATDTGGDRGVVADALRYAANELERRLRDAF